MDINLQEDNWLVEYEKTCTYTPQEAEMIASFHAGLKEDRAERKLTYVFKKELAKLGSLCTAFFTKSPSYRTNASLH